MTTARIYPHFDFDALHDINPAHVLVVTLLASSVVWIFQIKDPDKRIELAIGMLPTITALGISGKTAHDQDKDSKEKLKAARNDEVTSEIELKSRINPGEFSPSVNSLTPELPEVNERAAFFNQRLKNYAERIVIFQQLADYLERDKTQPKLIELAKEAEDFVLNKTNRLHLLTVGLLSPKGRKDFYQDIYRHLRVWLTVSIRYDVVLPARERVIKDRKLYAKAFTFLRDNRLASFLDPDEFHENRLDCLQVLKEYLTYLIVVIEKGTI